jgi:dCMP deaminase
MKEKFIKAHMQAASVYAQLSTAQRLQVGCVIVKDNTIIGIGYNGMPSGWTNECEYSEYVPKDEGYKTDQWFKDNGYRETAHGWMKLTSKPEVLHAETNAIAKVSRSTNSSEGSSIFITHAPCLDCAKIIYQAGIKEVYYQHTYRTESGLKFLVSCGIYVQHVEGV